MLCTNCKKNQANVFYKQNINGKVTEYSLCSECAEKLKNEGKLDLNVPDPFEFGDPFGFHDTFGSFGDFFGLKPFFAHPALGTREKKEEKKCTLCGSTFDDLVERGKIGCAECYRTFKDELRHTIENLHGKEKYVGRRPAKLSGGTKKAEAKSENKEEDRLSSLRAEMKQAVETEDFEKAATLRDEIRKLEGRAN